MLGVARGVILNDEAAACQAVILVRGVYARHRGRGFRGLDRTRGEGRERIQEACHKHVARHATNRIEMHMLHCKRPQNSRCYAARHSPFRHLTGS